jgi:hypothetical protein
LAFSDKSNKFVVSSIVGRSNQSLFFFTHCRELNIESGRAEPKTYSVHGAHTNYHRATNARILCRWRREIKKTAKAVRRPRNNKVSTGPWCHDFGAAIDVVALLDVVTGAQNSKSVRSTVRFTVRSLAICLLTRQSSGDARMYWSNPAKNHGTIKCNTDALWTRPSIGACRRSTATDVAAAAAARSHDCDDRGLVPKRGLLLSSSSSAMKVFLNLV